jgi:Transposase DDE domain
MVLTRIPPLARLIAGRYQDIFRDTGISHSMLCLFIAMTLGGIPFLSRLVRIACFSPSVSALSRAAGKFDSQTMNRAMRRLSWSVLKRVMKAPDDWIFVVDTTSNVKRTAGIEGSGFWANSKDEVFFGQHLMVLCAVNKQSGEAIPVAWKPCLKDGDRKPGTTSHDLVIDLIQALLEQGWPKLALVMDSWFDSVGLMKQLTKKGITFVIQLKSSRKPKTNPSPRSPKKLLIDIFSSLTKSSSRATTRENKPAPKLGLVGVKYIAGADLWIAGSGKDAKQIRVRVAAVYNHFKERNAFGYYATNDLSASFTWCWNMSRYRWNIEVCFRDLRQSMHWGKWASKCPEGANLSLVLPILVLGYLRETEAETPVISRLERLRDEEAVHTIEFFAENPKSQKRKAVKLRLLGTAKGKKPRITHADKPKSRANCKVPTKIAA